MTMSGISNLTFPQGNLLSPPHHCPPDHTNQILAIVFDSVLSHFSFPLLYQVTLSFHLSVSLLHWNPHSRQSCKQMRKITSEPDTSPSLAATSPICLLWFALHNHYIFFVVACIFGMSRVYICCQWW